MSHKQGSVTGPSWCSRRWRWLALTANETAGEWWSGVWTASGVVDPSRYLLMYASSGLVNTMVTRALGNLKTLVILLQHLQLFIEWCAVKRLTEPQRKKLNLAIELFKLRAYSHFLSISCWMTGGGGKRAMQRVSPCTWITGAVSTRTVALPAPRQRRLTARCRVYVHSDLKQPSLVKAAVEVIFVIRPAAYVLARLLAGFDDPNHTPFMLSAALNLMSAVFHLYVAWFMVRVACEWWLRCRHVGSSSKCSDRQKKELKCDSWLWHLFRPPLFGKVSA